ncbi:hypothetical protein RvY_16593 [Ramazzottius varieornatus]|uniref:Uncharacterized protein n=1 Tax=Ramazzottius varieornatus TaxID=947166 RepID=A0A1D1VZ15_RAMVA|nr:hypothetical protein RvY_16593 [Ramazzottius varieornatus]
MQQHDFDNIFNRVEKIENQFWEIDLRESELEARENEMTQYYLAEFGGSFKLFSVDQDDKNDSASEVDFSWMMGDV